MATTMQEIRIDVNMILAGDVGGTKTLLGLFERRSRRPHALLVHSFATHDFADLTAMVGRFASEPPVATARLESACFGVAGPVFGHTAELTNTDFAIDAVAVGRALGVASVRLLNDLQALATAVPVLDEQEIGVLQSGTRDESGPMALIAAGTGLGESVLHHIDGRLVPTASEAGHADWAARTDRDVRLLQALVARFGRAEVEHVLSGPGLVHIHAVTHDGPCLAVSDPSAAGAAAAISRAGLDRTCRGCAAALDLFVGAYGAEAGNLALRSMATGGVFVGGGIAPKIFPALSDGRFMRAFLDKGAFRPLLETIPVGVILNPNAGLLGAAIAAR
jgi:glucokinase